MSLKPEVAQPLKIFPSLSRSLIVTLKVTILLCSTSNCDTRYDHINQPYLYCCCRNHANGRASTIVAESCAMSCVTGNLAMSHVQSSCHANTHVLVSVEKHAPHCAGCVIRMRWQKCSLELKTNQTQGIALKAKREDKLLHFVNVCSSFFNTYFCSYSCLCYIFQSRAFSHSIMKLSLRFPVTFQFLLLFVDVIESIMFM